MPIGYGVVLSLDRSRPFKRLYAAAAFADHARGLAGHVAHFGQRIEEPFGGAGEGNAILRPARAGQTWLHGGQIEFDRAREDRVGRAGVAPQALRAGISFRKRDAMRIAPRRLQIVDRILVDGEEAARRAIFRGHVGHGRAIFDRKSVEAVPEIFDKLAHHAFLSKHLRDGEHEVRRRYALRQGAGEAEAYHFRDQHRNGLAQHRRLRLDAADAPAENRERVDHGRMAVRADKRIGKRQADAAFLFRPHSLREIFEVHLVANSGPWGHNLEICEGARPPAQELIALLVALVLQIGVDLKRTRIAEAVHHHRMVDNEIDGNERVDFGGVAVKPLHGVAHRGEVHHRRHACEILHQNPRGPESDLARRRLCHEPQRHGANVAVGHSAPVLEPEEIFQQDFQGEWQGGDAGQAVGFGAGQGEIFVLPAIDFQNFSGV